MSQSPAARDPVERQIEQATASAHKDYRFDEDHPPGQPADLWFQHSEEGEILFVVFYSQACRWSRCLGCNLPAKTTKKHVSYKWLMAQIDWTFKHPAVVERSQTLRKVIVSNNGSVLDEKTFSSTALIYLIAKLNLHLPKLAVLSLETRVEYVDPPELEFIARALQEGETPTALELAIGFEAFDEHIRNEVFRKGLGLEQFEGLCRMISAHGFRLKCYFMQKPVPGMSDVEAIQDVHQAVDYLCAMSQRHGIKINMHLNPTYVAAGTELERAFRQGDYAPPRLRDVAKAALHGENRPISLFLGLSEEGLAVAGGSFVRPGEEELIVRLEQFNCTQDYGLLRTLAESPTSRYAP
jgi:radical SAM enzyme (TIGR01210 family)